MNRRSSLRLALGFFALASCQDDGGPSDQGMDMAQGAKSDEIPLKITLRCPGSPACDNATGPLEVGVSAYDITPVVEPFTDDNKNGIWDKGEPYEDRNGNNTFDSFWLAGYGNRRLAYGVHDPVWARALALRQGKTTVVLVAVDALGLFREETLEVEKLLPKDLGISQLLLHATHCHETADVVGAWGVDELTYGVNESYQGQLRRGIAAAATAAVKNLRKATRVTFGAVPVSDPPNGDMTRYVTDVRDPVVIDNVLRTIQFTEVTPQGVVKPIATLINWAHHPESVGDKNHLISSDFVHYLREKVEQRGAGTVVYVSGALGGQIGPGTVRPIDADGRVLKDKGFPMAEAIGKSVANFALRAMADPQAKTLPGTDVNLALRSTVFNVRVDNVKFHLAAKLKIYRRNFCCYEMDRPMDEDNPPWIETAVSYLKLGPASIITNPGELLPELFIGGYKGEYRGTYPFIDTMADNAPDVSKAPQPPYLIDVMDGERAYRQTWGPTLDFIGYIVPRYNFVLDEKRPYLDEAKGDHYEETNSLGPYAEPQIVGTMRQLVLDGRPNQPR